MSLSLQSTLRELVQQNKQQQDYTAMLLGLEEAATQATAGALSQSESLTEPFVAYEVTRTLPQGASPTLTTKSALLLDIMGSQLY